MSRKVIGICSLCRGNVIVPELWSGVPKVIPKCETCGAVPERMKSLPVIPMMPMNPKSLKEYADFIFRDKDGGA